MRIFLEMTNRHPVPLVLTILAVLAFTFGPELAPMPWQFVMFGCALVACLMAVLTRLTTYARNFIERRAYDHAILMPCVMCMVATLYVVFHAPV